MPTTTNPTDASSSGEPRTFLAAFLAGVCDRFVAFWTKTDPPLKMLLIGILIGLIAHDLVVSLPLRLFGLKGVDCD